MNLCVIVQNMFIRPNAKFYSLISPEDNAIVAAKDTTNWSFLQHVIFNNVRATNGVSINITEIMFYLEYEFSIVCGALSMRDSSNLVEWVFFFKAKDKKKIPIGSAMHLQCISSWNIVWNRIFFYHFTVRDDGYWCWNDSYWFSLCSIWKWKI